MIWNQMSFHNTAELEAIPGLPGWRLQRFPRAVRDKLGHGAHEKGRFVSQASTGCEIRFVTDAPFIRIALSATVEDGDIVVYNGDFFHSMHRLKTGEICTLQLNKPERFDEVDASALRQGRFSPQVWRIAISRNYYPGRAFQVAFHHLDTFGHDVRPPMPEELPVLTMLAYGSSITHGSGATVQHLAYIQQTASRLGVDVWNKGVGGSCLIEPAMTDYLMQLEDWDLAVLELGVNMRGMFTPDEFEARARYLISGLLANQPGKPVVLISIFPNSADVRKDANNPLTESNREFIQRLQRIYDDLQHPHLHFVDGHDILTDFSRLTNDLIHPSDEGHIQMGQHLADRLRALVDKL
ncbi:GDSL-type esterase/lipase family protein [Paenibacillus oryzisoli]|uniref:GDSL-type esterase/lipase family protein n=1 Tax=Paenibacillus oryzisoli TaxID=1850517 RepID=UPI003D2D4E68